MSNLLDALKKLKSKGISLAPQAEDRPLNVQQAGSQMGDVDVETLPPLDQAYWQQDRITEPDHNQDEDWQADQPESSSLEAEPFPSTDVAELSGSGSDDVVPQIFGPFQVTVTSGFDPVEHDPAVKPSEDALPEAQAAEVPLVPESAGEATAEVDAAGETDASAVFEPAGESGRQEPALSEPSADHRPPIDQRPEPEREPPVDDSFLDLVHETPSFDRSIGWNEEPPSDSQDSVQADPSDATPPGNATDTAADQADDGAEQLGAKTHVDDLEPAVPSTDFQRPSEPDLPRAWPPQGPAEARSFSTVPEGDTGFTEGYAEVFSLDQRADLAADHGSWRPEEQPSDEPIESMAKPPASPVDGLEPVGELKAADRSIEPRRRDVPETEHPADEARVPVFDQSDQSDQSHQSHQSYPYPTARTFDQLPREAEPELVTEVSAPGARIASEPTESVEVPFEHIELSELGLAIPRKASPETKAFAAWRSLSEKGLAFENALRNNLAQEGLASQYRHLLKSIIEQLPAGPPAVLVWVGADQEPHVSMTLAQLASVLVQRDAGVLLVDANLPTRLLSKQFDLGRRPGLAEVCGGIRTWQDAIVLAGSPHLHILPGGGQTAAAPVTANFIRSMMNEWTEQFQVVLVDAGTPEVSMTDCFARASDAVYLVVRLGKTARKQALLATKKLRSLNCPLKGCIVTNVQSAGKS